VRSKYRQLDETACNGDPRAVHAQILQTSQAAQARWDGAVELVVAEVAESQARTPQRCAMANRSVAHAQALQPTQAAQAGWDGAAELVVLQ